MPRLTVGLTGGIASGKSLVASSFERLGVPVLDADQVAREVVAPGSPALSQITTEFGPDYVREDGTLNRRRMRELVFADAQARHRLERITHPHIRARLIAWRDAQTAPYCILAVAILIEAGMDTLVDRVLLIDAPAEFQRERLIARDGISPALADQMLAAQATREQRLARAHDVLSNSATPEEVPARVAQLHAFYLDLAASGRVHAPGLYLPQRAGGRE